MNAPRYVFDHVGMLVHDIDGATQAVCALGYDTFSVRFEDKRQRVDIVFASSSTLVHAPRLELVQSMAPDSVVAGLLVKAGATAYHLCFRTSDLDGAMEQLRDAGYMPVRDPAPSPAFGGALFCFLYQRQLGLVELVLSETSV